MQIKNNLDKNVSCGFKADSRQGFITLMIHIPTVREDPQMQIQELAELKITIENEKESN